MHREERHWLSNVVFSKDIKMLVLVHTLLLLATKVAY